MENISIILSAGIGKRMHSSLPKVMHPICGRPMVQYVIDAAKDVTDKVIVVISNKIDKSIFKDVTIAYQDVPLGTGDATKSALNAIKDASDDARILILTGDNPLIKSSDLKSFLSYCNEKDSDAALLTAVAENPEGFGRIIRNKEEFVRIVEEKDATEEEKKIKEINTGIYVFKKKYLSYSLQKITPNNAQKEYYLTDALSILKDAGIKINVKRLERSLPVYGVNNRKELSLATKIIQQEILDRLMLKGVTILNPETVSIDYNVVIGNDTVILPNVLIEGETKIGNGCTIGPNTRITDALIGNGTDVQFSVIIQSEIGENCTIGPFSYIRPGNRMSKNVKIGTFVEVKKSHFGEDTKVPHLSYIGDATIGKNVNIGAGTITCNYSGLEGKKKNPTFIEDNVFIGSNNTLVAPVKIKKGAYTAAGSAITKDVPESALAIGRARQVNKENWVKRRKKSNG